MNPHILYNEVCGQANQRQVDMNMKPEKRKYFRHPIQVPVQLHELSNQKAPPEKIECEDLNDHGLCFHFAQALSRGTALLLSIPVQEQVFQVNARVAYSKKEAKTGTFRTGVFFEDTESAFRIKIAEEILKIQEYQKSLSKTLGREVSEAEAARKWVQQFAKHFASLF